MEESESPKQDNPLKESMKERVRYAAENIDNITELELRDLYSQITINKMKKKIQKTAKWNDRRAKVDQWKENRSDKKAKKLHIKEEVQKLKEKLNGG
ncbi:hypothetical protein LCGC14_2451540 [marine sediment metagenome]|uniref:Uncharacterized protein n=1 Tax=marine sediment metagenome TaxID=412755 RepID=A0A0F9C3J1_9ZZZZ